MSTFYASIISRNVEANDQQNPSVTRHAEWPQWWEGKGGLVVAATGLAGSRLGQPSNDQAWNAACSVLIFWLMLAWCQRPVPPSIYSDRCRVVHISSSCSFTGSVNKACSVCVCLCVCVSSYERDLMRWSDLICPFWWHGCNMTEYIQKGYSCLCGITLNDFLACSKTISEWESVARFLCDRWLIRWAELCVHCLSGQR